MNPEEQSILIVDDVPKNIQLLGSILKQEKYELEFATSGKEALEWLASKRFELVLLDIMMPEMDGFDICRKIKENPTTREIAVIFLTAKADSESIIKGFETGAVDYITKPFNTKELKMRVRTHLTIQHQRKQIEQKNAYEKKIFSVIGHDLRSPVGNIRTYIDAFLMVTNELDKNTQVLLKDLYILADNAFSLLENLLNWAKSQSGNIICRPQSENIPRLIQIIIKLFKIQAENKNIRLKYEGPKELCAFVDRELISSVIRNLIANALKFTRRNGNVTVSASTKKVRGKYQVVLQVRDNGVGMSPESIEKLLTRNIHYTTYGTENEKGSGLGIQLCKEFITLNNGELWIESQEGKGSTFFVSLPSSEK
ncbi:MAG: hybrid sensor histidine kinase/response regulator [Bacteroidales bacterium]|nr:hybrid sensor histidine kinase/response regulator [Bacteroidales bacterium]